MSMTCLSDADIQAVADGEAADDMTQHASACARCETLVRARVQRMTAIQQALDPPATMPAAVFRRIDAGLASAAPGGGATRLRDIARPRFGRAGDPRAGRNRGWVYSGLAVAAATLVAVFVVAPAVKGPSTVSAAEILGKSATQLATPITSGVESLEYELVLDGVPRDVMPDQPDGAYRVKQIIDHDVAGRFYFSSYAPDGAMMSAIAEDPRAGRRVMAVRLDNQSYRFDVSLPANPALSEPELQRLHMQASVAMMQASGNQHMQVVDTPGGQQYRIDVPRVSAVTPAAVWDLAEAHVLVDARDYHIVEFAVKGTFLKQPYSMSYRLIRREMKAASDVPSDAFDVPEDPGAITLRGEGSPIAPRDALVIALRELARAKARS